MNEGSSFLPLFTTTLKIFDLMYFVWPMLTRIFVEAPIATVFTQGHVGLLLNFRMSSPMYAWCKLGA